MFAKYKSIINNYALLKRTVLPLFMVMNVYRTMFAIPSAVLPLLLNFRCQPLEGLPGRMQSGSQIMQAPQLLVKLIECKV